jgi:aldose 1-epimerase
MEILRRGDQVQYTDPLKDPSACTLAAADLEVTFLPGHGMLGASLRYRGLEMLGRVADLVGAAAKGSTAGIPLLYPWANRLAAPGYRAAGREVALDLSSPLLHLDDRGLPMHGVPWSLLGWDVTEARRDFLAARLDWTHDDALAVFPFRHRIEMGATLGSDGLTIETSVIAGEHGRVPVSFGFHPYFGFGELPRAQWRLQLPAMRKLVLDPRGIPTGDEEPFGGLNVALGELNFDDGFELSGEHEAFSIVGAGRRITVELLEGYRYAQVFAPKGQSYIALEPMTAPTSALTSGRGLRVLEPRETFRAAFRIGITVSRSE